MTRALALGAILLSACLSVPQEESAMCARTSDCDPGEVCDDGVCWGNPPERAFVAVVSPPSERNRDLMAKELAVPAIARDGWLDDIHLEPPARYRGTLQLVCELPLSCDERALGATVTITRPSQFPGGPGFSAVTTVQPGDTSFEVNLPPSTGNGAPYTMTVVPSGRGDAPGNADDTGQLVPPMRTQFSVDGDFKLATLSLGGYGLATVSGTVLSATLEPQSLYRVVALGRWDRDQPLTEVSTVDYTGADGRYLLRLSQGLVDNVVIVAKPYGTDLRPTLRVTNVPSDQYAVANLVLPAEVGTATPLEIPVEGIDSGGQRIALSGARVIVTGTVETGPNASASLTVEQTTDMGGTARLTVLDGSLTPSYRLSVVPPPSSTHGAVFDRELALGSLTSAPLRLPARSVVRGTVYDHDGEPAADVLVTARPALRFLWNLEADAQAFLGEVPVATTITSGKGEFVVWVDPVIDGVFGFYDLVFEPPATGVVTRMPSWTETVELPRDATQGTVTQPSIVLPDAAYVRTAVRDLSGSPLQGAEVKLYTVETDLLVCEQTRFEPRSCPIPARLVGRGTSNDAGRVHLTLPR